jgi:hypothetical protein
LVARPAWHCQTQDEFTAGLTNAFAKAGHQAGVNGEVVTKVLLAAEVLPVGVLDPDRHHFLVGQIAGVLEQLQPDHQTNGVAGAANAGFVQAAKALVARFPIDLLGQLNQRMAQVDEIDQFLAE